MWPWWTVPHSLLLIFSSGFLLLSSGPSACSVVPVSRFPLLVPYCGLGTLSTTPSSDMPFPAETLRPQILVLFHSLSLITNTRSIVEVQKSWLPYGRGVSGQRGLFHWPLLQVFACPAAGLSQDPAPAFCTGATTLLFWSFSFFRSFPPRGQHRGSKMTVDMTGCRTQPGLAGGPQGEGAQRQVGRRQPQRAGRREALLQRQAFRLAHCNLWFVPYYIPLPTVSSSLLPHLLLFYSF